MLFAILSAALLFTFPGVLLAGQVKELSRLAKITCTAFLSVGFWVGVAWFIAAAGLPLNIVAASLLGISILAFVVFRRKFVVPLKLPNHIEIRTAWVYVALLVAIVLMLMPLTFVTIPPGCDTTMHGYISRLIINNNGLPSSYRPILPVDYFGSYSAGFHVLTALIAAMQVSFLQDAINVVTFLSYPLAMLGMVFLLSQFVQERTAIVTTIIFWGLNSTFESTIWWGGNPTVLGFGCSMFAAGLLLHGLKNQDAFAFRLSALAVAAVLLIHAIPAICFVYLCLPGVVVCFILFSDRRVWLLKNGALMVAIAVVLLLPFLMHFKNDNSPELVLKVKQWQLLMMHNTFSPNVLKNAWGVLLQITGRVGEIPLALSCLALIGLLAMKKTKELGIITLFVAYLFVLVINYGYWFLPLSELLYPERIVFYVIVALSFYLAYALEYLQQDKFAVTIFKKRVHPHLLPLVVFLVISIAWTNNNSNALRKSEIQLNDGVKEAMKWIDTHTEKNALVEVSYNDVGMWMPTFTNRATLGCHLHFIHEVTHVADSMNASNNPRYIFLTRRDLASNAPVLAKTTGRKLVFSNSDAQIFH